MAVNGRARPSAHGQRLHKTLTRRKMLPPTTAADASRAHRSRSVGLFDDGDPELALRASAQPLIRAAGAADEPAAPATPPRVITAADRAAQDKYLEESFGLCATDEALEAQIARL